MTNNATITTNTTVSTNLQYFLDINEYNPDTLDLNTDLEARDYWLRCFSETVKKFAIQAAKSCQQTDPTGSIRAREFETDYIEQLIALKEQHNQHDCSPQDDNRLKPLTIRQLLELNEICLHRHGFIDPWKEQKCLENTAALLLFRHRLNELDKLDNNEKWLEIFKGILAGNMFDWGAQAVSEIIENNRSFGLQDALKCIQPRPWLVDGFDSWLERIQGPPHRCAVIFVDNSGVDIVLGIIPFARELLRRDTQVMLCANTEPSLNDITSLELDEVIRKCCTECNILQQSYQNKRLSIHANGHSSPCLDMRQIPADLAMAVTTNKADLLVIEGMGRALHTNLKAKFKCETLKLAVIKNKWWANRLGGEIFSIICKYEPI